LPVALGLVALVALVVGLGAMPLAAALGPRLGMIDLPRRNEAQSRPLPRTGGYAVFLAFFAAMGVSLLVLPRFPDEWPKLVGLALGALAIVPIAILDDRARLSPWPQLAAQIGVALIACAAGIVIDEVSNPFGGLIAVPDLLVWPLTVLWIVGMINTVNFVDGVDGLAGGVGCIAAVTLFIVSLAFGQFSLSALPLALAVACLAFLRWNFHPSRLILGSSGSMLIGFLLAVLAIIGGAKIATALLVLGLPIADVATVILYRLWHRRSPFHGGDAAHLHHRLLALGLSQRQVVGVFYALCASFGLLAIAWPRVGRLYGLLAQAVVVAVILLFVFSRQRAVGGTDKPAKV
ncbi:MAG: undecaprenyl/decaprenyl-phosphate alpha-N-acetylglucosaminyl 1-phosphate transferase, partial [Dehalococcoidia bacterium]|nr:undecaprenyl/decaprenyl-phosphate alpha-N-acetylglucosaminyl 1-phosphate transferase [Dehalococcoidia bacterium]